MGFLPFFLFVSAYIVQCARLIFEIQTSKRQSTTRPARFLRRRLFGPLDSTIILQMEVPTFGKKNMERHQPFGYYKSMPTINLL